MITLAPQNRFPRSLMPTTVGTREAQPCSAVSFVFLLITFLTVCSHSSKGKGSCHPDSPHFRSIADSLLAQACEKKPGGCLLVIRENVSLFQSSGLEFQTLESDSFMNA